MLYTEKAELSHAIHGLLRNFLAWVSLPLSLSGHTDHSLASGKVWEGCSNPSLRLLLVYQQLMTSSLGSGILFLRAHIYQLEGCEHAPISKDMDFLTYFCFSKSVHILSSCFIYTVLTETIMFK